MIILRYFCKQIVYENYNIQVIYLVVIKELY